MVKKVMERLIENRKCSEKFKHKVAVFVPKVVNKISVNLK